MQSIRRIIRSLFGFAEKVHTFIWLLQILGIMAALTGIVALVRRYMQEDVKLFMIMAFFIAGFGLLTLPRLIYKFYQSGKSVTPPAAPLEPITQLYKTFEVCFDYLPGNMLDNGWVRAYPNDSEVRPKATLVTEAPILGSVVIDAPDGHAYDYKLPRNVMLSDRLVFAAKYAASDAMIFTRLELSSKDGRQTEYKWIKYVPGTGSPDTTKGYDEHEYAFPIVGEPLQDGWRKFEISLPDVVAQTWAKRGLIFKGITVFRLRASLSISPIEFYESRRSSARHI